MTVALIRGRRRKAVCAAVLVGAICGCGSRRPIPQAGEPAPSAPRILPLNRVIVLETSGPTPSDTAVSFTAGTPHTIVLRHGAPESIPFARLEFPPAAFSDSGQPVTVEVRPRPGVYGLDLTTSRPLRGGATVKFMYARFFSAPARAKAEYRSDIAYERALAVGRLLPENQIELLSSTRPTPDNLEASLPAAGSYLVAAPQ